MYHKFPHKIKCRLESGILSKNRLLVAFAALVDNAARGLASGLAGSLALAATAGGHSILDILGFDGLDSAHLKNPPCRICAHAHYALLF
jgi:hypothetical protein